VLLPIAGLEAQIPWRKIGNLNDPTLLHDPILSRAVADENVELHRELQLTQDRLRECRIALEKLANLRAERAAGEQGRPTAPDSTRTH
jgi:hypothetical protein